MSKKHFNFVRANKLFSRLLIGLTVLFLSVVWLLPAFSGVADAAQLTSRSLTLGDGQAATSSTWTYTFTPSNLAIQSIKFVACTTAVATYGLASVNTLPANCQTTGIPTGININNASTVDTVPSGWTTARFSPAAQPAPATVTQRLRAPAIIFFAPAARRLPPNRLLLKP